MTTDDQPCSLHDPDVRPGADVVVYDGQCRFCTAQVQRLARWDRAGRLAFLSLHDPRVAQRYPDLSPTQLMEQLYLVRASGQRLGGAAAFRYLSRRLPRLWPLAPALHLPGSLPLWQWCYRQVARRRYRLAGAPPCDSDTCHVHFR
ncbi:MAG: DUF393 domain-containing protein [Pirellulaceae bacterium]|jgi:predicted DCC family thiol-disulfide oxidoreductase YuxK|nr:DUF393 domain-containing protein [Pirellulaceae bacterium]